MQGPIGIIGAMAVEVQALIDQLEDLRQEEIGRMCFYRGRLSGVDCVVVQCGVGKVNAALCAQTLILKYAPRLVINVGVAGGVGVGIGDLVVASDCVQHDFDDTALGTPLGSLSIRKQDGSDEEIIHIPSDSHAAQVLLAEAASIYGGAHSGVVATGDVFVADPEKNRWLNETFGAKAVEMEGGSIAQVCYMNQVPYAVLRAISDNANDESPTDFPAFTKACSEKTTQLLKQALPKL